MTAEGPLLLVIDAAIVLVALLNLLWLPRSSRTDGSRPRGRAGRYRDERCRDRRPVRNQDRRGLFVIV